jgi:hypothetical protein
MVAALGCREAGLTWHFDGQSSRKENLYRFRRGISRSGRLFRNSGLLPAAAADLRMSIAFHGVSTEAKKFCTNDAESIKARPNLNASATRLKRNDNRRPNHH